MFTVFIYHHTSTYCWSIGPFFFRLNTTVRDYICTTYIRVGLVSTRWLYWSNMDPNPSLRVSTESDKPCSTETIWYLSKDQKLWRETSILFIKVFTMETLNGDFLTTVGPCTSLKRQNFHFSKPYVSPPLSVTDLLNQPYYKLSLYLSTNFVDWKSQGRSDKIRLPR